MLIRTKDSELMQGKEVNGQDVECYNNLADSPYDSQYMLVIGNEGCTQDTMIFAYFEDTEDMFFIYDLIK